MGNSNDFETYNKWSNSFSKIHFDSINKTKVSKKIKKSTNIFLMAGKGLRFIKENFTEPKPLIKVSGKPMVFQTIDHLPKSDFNVFLLRQDMDKINVLKKLIKQKFKRPLIQT